MRPTYRTISLLAAGLMLAGSLAACSDDPPVDDGRQVLGPGDGQPHTHDTFLGDGTTADAGGYSMAGLTFPTESRVPSDLTFQILDSRGEPVTEYVEEQTKLIHLYVVRDDLTDFRHVHPVLGDDGTWTARVDLTDPGRYRVVAEFVPDDEEQNPDGSHVVLGERAQVAGESPAVPDEPGRTGSDGMVTVTAPETLPAGEDTQFDLTVSDGDRGVLNLGTYLGSYAHLTGFDTATGAFVHAHPLGTPSITDDGSDLTFHTALGTPGTYRFFVQVRVDGFVHTVPLTTTVA
ncbi:hypothetical protein [Nocardioides sp.]|uniref:hypothetical protein n=1 Tax=Nocardioides sp. TaxID=35761 RepID=UPI002723B580|nr:hypothetical protein [Nocardioides sp.]MDO9455884.1 hypothetical protein [Nocardioides sp.]